jgi:hypothetical protein
MNISDEIVDSITYQYDVCSQIEKAMIYYRRKGIEAAAEAYNIDVTLEKYSALFEGYVDTKYIPPKELCFNQDEQYYGARDTMLAAGITRSEVENFLIKHYELVKW